MQKTGTALKWCWPCAALHACTVPTRLALHQDEQENQCNLFWMEIKWDWKISITAKKHVYGITVNIQFLGRTTALPSSTASQHPLVKLIDTALSLPVMGSAYCIGNLHGFGRTWWDAHNEMKKSFFPLISSLLPGEQIGALPGLWAEQGCSTGLFAGMVPVPHPSAKFWQWKSSAGLIQSASCPHCFFTAWSSKCQQGHILFSRVLSHRMFGGGGVGGDGCGKETSFLTFVHSSHLVLPSLNSPSASML